MDRQMYLYNYFSKQPWVAQLANASGVAGAFLSPNRDQKYSSACPFFPLVYLILNHLLNDFLNTSGTCNSTFLIGLLCFLLLMH